MKSTLLLICFLFTLADFTYSQNTYVPDDNFEQALIDMGFDSGNLDDYVPTKNIDTITILNISGKTISNLTGIENFSALIVLNCSNNNLESISLNSNLQLEELLCYNNALNSIDVSENYFLVNLYCYNNNLTTFDLSTNANLEILVCSNNELTGLDLSSNSALKHINCSNNQLSFLNLINGNNNNMIGGAIYETGIDTRNNTKLYCIQVDDADLADTYISWRKDAWSGFSNDCSTFELKMAYVPDDNFEQALISMGYDSGTPDDYVPVTSISKVKSLNIQYKGIKDLTGIEEFVSLENLNCRLNQLTELNLQNNKNLKYIDCLQNKITHLDLSNNMKITYLNCYGNLLTSLDLSFNNSLTTLVANNNQLTSLNLRNGNNHNMTVNAQNPDLLCIDVDDEEAAETYSGWQINSYTGYSENCSNYMMEMTYIPDDNFEQALIDMGLDYVTILNDSIPTMSVKKLKSLNISYRNIADLTGIKDFISLENLNCNFNDISELDLSKNTNLNILQCQNNNLSELNLSENKKLNILQCQYNNLSELNLIENDLLTQLDCYNNILINLDLSSNILLTNLNAESNQLTGLNLRNGNNSNMIVKVNYNVDLFCIEVDDPVATIENSNWNKNAYTVYSEYCSNYKIEMTYVPDDNFEQALIDLELDFSTELNDSVPTESIEHIKILNIENKNISDLTGIEYFKELKELRCKSLKCISINLTKNTDLEYLDCSFGNLDSLNLQLNSKLKTVKSQYNSLNNISIGENSSLEYLDCSANELSKINNIIAPNLTYFNCSSNKLININLTDLTNLEYLNCNNNKLKEIDLSKNPFLTRLECQNNLLTFLNLQNGGNEKLWLYANNNMPICIQVDDFETAETNSYWHKDSWSIYSENCTGYTIEKTFIPDNNFEQALVDFGYDKDGINDSIPTAIVNTITHLIINEKNISDLTGIEDFISLTRLWCAKNQINEINLDLNTLLVNLDVYDNKLKSLDVSNCPNLASLSCGKNQLNKIDVSLNTNLGNIRCQENNITNIDISKNPKMYYLAAQNNNLTSLNLKNGYNKNLQIVVTENPNLYCIQVDDPVASESYSKWYKDEHASYSVNCYNKTFKKTYIPDDNFERVLIDLGFDSGVLDDSVFTASIIEITDLNVRDKNIKSLQGIEDFENLSSLRCSFNQVTELNLNNNKKLTYLDCNNNNLKSLKVENCTLLDFLNCSMNNLTELNISANSNLTRIYIADNKFINLNVQNGNNQIVSHFVSENNPDLLCIKVDDSSVCENSLKWVKDSWAHFSEDCSIATGTRITLSDPEVYPNPVTQRVFIDTGIKPANLKVFDISGKIILEKKNLKSGWLDIDFVDSGIYFFQFSAKGNKLTLKKIIVK